VLLGFSEVTKDGSERADARRQIEALNAQLTERVEDLRRANVEVQQRNRQLTVVNAAIAAISEALDPREVLQRIVDAARELVGARYGALGVSDDSGRIVEFITSGITPQEREAIGPLPQGHGLLGALITEGAPLRVARIQDDRRSSGFPPNHPPMTTLLGVPIHFQSEAVGDLYLTDKISAVGEAEVEFSEEDERLLILLANHAAVAITNSRLYNEAKAARDRLQIWNERLELEVAERTRQIGEQSRDLTRRVLQAQEEERKRIARELHDESAQSLSTLLIGIDLLEQSLSAESQGAVREPLDRLRRLAKGTLDEIRSLSHDLRPTILDDVGLEAALEWLGAELAQGFRGEVRVEVEQGARQAGIGPEGELALFRIAQEALNNARKYAHASVIEVGLIVEAREARLTVRDDGTGFDLAALQGPTRDGGLGLYGMRERAALVGGDLEIESAPGQGTRIDVRLPLLEEPASADSGNARDNTC